MKKRIYAVLLCLLVVARFASAKDPDAASTASSAPTTMGLATDVRASSANGNPLSSGAALSLPGTIPSNSALPPAITEKGGLPSAQEFAGQTNLQQKGAAETAAKDALEGAKPGAGETVEMSAAEKIMSAEEMSVPKPQPFSVGKLTQFGYSFFRQSNAFAPAVDVPVGPDYIVGPGDTLIVTVSGSLDATLPLEVNRSGEIILPRVGAVRVWGVPFSKVPDVVRSALSTTFRNVQLNVTMGKLRLMKVYVVGEVNAPGDYDISALSTVINALAAAGGPTKEGTLRKVQVLRGGKVVENVDLYDFFLRGDKSHDIRLQPGDTINVPVHGKLVGIAGNARKPAIYEFPDALTLKELFEMAGGVSSSSSLQRIQITRVVANSKKIVADFNFDPNLSNKNLEAQAAAVKLQDMDLVKIFPIDLTLRDNVQLLGHVKHAGGHALTPGMRLKDLIRPDNLLPEYYPDTVEITRLVLPDLHPEQIYVSLEGAMRGEKDDNILLNEFDSVRIFSRWEMEEVPQVRISGEVQKPGTYRLFKNMTLRNLILAAGNLKRTAYLKSAEVTRTDISKQGVQSHLINVDLEQAMAENPDENIPLHGFDEVVIRRLPEWKEETDRYCTLTGEVLFPGVYPILRGETLSSVIQRAGGFTDRAYLKAAKFTRKLTRELQQKRMDEVIARTEQEITRKQQELASVASSKEELEATKAALEGMKASLEKLKQAKAEGRISMTLSSLDKLKNSPADIELQGGDTLEIPQSPNSIMVFGEVYNPTTVVEARGATVGDYLKKAGGPTVSADEDEMYVVKADGTVVSHREKDGFFFDSFMSMNLSAGDTIVVPQRLEKVAWMRDLKDIAYIIGQTALAAGVLVAAGL